MEYELFVTNSTDIKKELISLENDILEQFYSKAYIKRIQEANEMNIMHDERIMKSAREVHYKGTFNIFDHIKQIKSLHNKWDSNDSRSRSVHIHFQLDEFSEYKTLCSNRDALFCNCKEQDEKNKQYMRQIQQRNNVEHPTHYTSHPSKIECITITQHYNFCIGNAMKYLWRAGIKKEEGLTPVEKEIEDCKKAIWYINKHIESLK